MTTPANTVFLKVPADQWELIFSTLSLDARSSAFDRDLRRQLNEALESIVELDPAELPEFGCPKCEDVFITLDDLLDHLDNHK